MPSSVGGFGARNPIKPFEFFQSIKSSRGAVANILTLSASSSTFGVQWLRESLKSLSAATSINFAGALPKQVNESGQLLAHTAAFSGTTSKRAQDAVLAQFGLSGTTGKQTGAGITGTFGFAGSVAKQIGLVLSVQTVTFTGSLVRKIGAVLSATLGFVGLVARQVGNVILATLGFSGITGKQTGIGVSGSLGFSGVISKQTLATLNSQLPTFSSALTKQIGVVTAAIFGLAATVARQTGLVLSSAFSFSALTAKQIGVSLNAASSTFSGLLAEAKTKIMVFLASMASITGLVSKQVSESGQLQAGFGVSAQAGKQISKALAASLNLVGSVGRQIGRVLNAIISTWSVIWQAVKQSTPPVPPFFQPLALGKILRSFGVSFANPATVITSSNGIQVFQNNGNQFLVIPSSSNLYKKLYRIVAGGDIIIPSSAINAAFNLSLILKGFSQRRVPAIAIQDDVMAVLPSAQPLSIGTTSWQLICKVSGTKTEDIAQSIKMGGYLTADYIMTIAGVSYEGTLISNNNPFLEGVLQFSLGAQFSGSVSGLDMFQADLYQFETQEM